MTPVEVRHRTAEHRSYCNQKFENTCYHSVKAACNLEKQPKQNVQNLATEKFTFQIVILSHFLTPSKRYFGMVLLLVHYVPPCKGV